MEKQKAKYPALVRPRRIIGDRLLFRDAGVGDAEFILGLRTDPVKSRHLSATPNDVERQRDWLSRYAQDRDQVYFIIEGYSERLGTVRLYDVQGPSFCWGSWIIKAGAPSSCAIESALIVYAYALGLGFDRSHFEVRKNNLSVWKFHERFGATRTEEDDHSFYYSIDKPAITTAALRYKRFLPTGIEIF